MRTTRTLVVAAVLAALASCTERSSSPASEVGTTRQAVGGTTLTLSPGSAAYNGGGSPPAVAVDPGLVVTSSSTLTGASVSITSGFVAGQDVLSFATIGSISASYNASQGTLTLSGNGTDADYQAALRTVKYSNSSGAPTAGTRVVSISLGTAVSNPDNGHFYEFVTSPNTSWTAAKAAAAARSYLGLTGYLCTITSAAEDTFIHNKLSSDGWIGAQATPETTLPRVWKWANGPEDGTSFCNHNSGSTCTAINGAYMHWNGGEPNNAGGEGCGEIYFGNGGSWNDLPCGYTGLGGYVVEYGGSGTDPSVTISGTRNVVVSYTATSVTTTAGTLNWSAGSGAAVIDPGVTVGGTGTFTSATVSITANFASGQDVVAMPATGPITASYAAGTGVLTLTGTGTASDYQAAFRAVTYNNTSGSPSTSARTIRFLVDSASATRSLQIKVSSSVAVSSSSPSQSFQQSLTFTATLLPSASTGSVEFFDGVTSLGTATVSGGVATKSTSALTIGTHNITAVYAGDTARLGSTSPVFVQTITTMSAGQGPCNASNEASFCTSGKCNVTTSTCGNPSGASCTAANQCANNICGLNNLCGTPNGGACTAGTAASCQTGVCSPNNNTCIPVGGCAVNADCSAGQLCNASSLQCETAPGITTTAGTTVYDALGADVPVDGQLTVVGSNPITGATVTIGTGFVAAQDSLVYSTVNGITGSYNPSSGVLTLSGSASSAQYQAALRSVKFHNSAGAVPNTAVRTISFGVGTAVANGDNGHFYEYVPFTGTWVAAKAAAAGRTYVGLKGYLVTITSAAENDFVRGKLSNDGWIGAQSNPETSFPRTWSWVTGPDTGTPFCSNPSSTVCNPINGAYANWANGEPNNYGIGEGCGQIYFANSGRWNDLPCNSGNLSGYVVEYGGSMGDPNLTLSAAKSVQVRAAASMTVASSKLSTQLHESVTFTATLTPGSATGTVQFVVDGVDYGAPVTISAGVAQLSASDLPLGSHTITARYSGNTQNQAATGALASPQVVNPMSNGVGPCDETNASTDCASGVCGASGECGYAVNEGPCVAGNTSACRSGVCSVGEHCMPATAGGCYVDGDCGAGTYCNRASNTCVALIAIAEPLPNDGLHDGICANGSSSLCVSGECNVVSHTCSVSNGVACSVAGGCTSNACASSGRCVPAGAGSCWADSDCMGDQYCNRVSFTCTAKQLPGEQIANDGLHDGTCSGSGIAPTCATGICNVAASTCASATGATCSTNVQCQYGTCSGGKCGFQDGEPGCTASTTHLCQSGACGTSGNCIPAGPDGCFVDADCAGGTKYCERSTLSCVAKGLAGTALPNDGALHEGVCTSALAQATCVSGECNAVTNTCASANSATCVDATQCVTNVCGSNGKCGQANGDGPCTVAGGATSCQSGFCNASANGSTSACVPSSTSCWVDQDCAAGEYCARDTFTCTATLVAGGPLPNDGLHPACPLSHVNGACSTGLCNPITNTCADDLGNGCAAANECVSNVCGNNGKCGYADGQAGCSASTQSAVCQSAACTPSGVCAPGGGCFIDSDCASTQFCDRSTLHCSAKLLAGSAIPTDGLHDGHCNMTGAASCISGQCNVATDTCAASNEADCASADQCITNVCGTNGKCGFADGQVGCGGGRASDCQSGACSVDGVCVPAGAAHCWADVDCPAAQHCQRVSFTCVDDGLPGDAIANDALHTGVCSAVTAQAVCQSGLCNPTTNTCASDISASCTAKAQCVVDICGNNGQCGLANGEAGCTAATAADCQSGVCSVSGVCMPGSGCWVDHDCAAGQYCDRASTTCRSQQPQGGKLPDDGLHAAVCTADDAKSICSSGLCNAVTNTCGVSNGEGCTDASECVSNICAADGHCGAVDGSTCTDDSVCRAGCVEGRCVSSDVRRLSGGGGCSSTDVTGYGALLAIALLLMRRSRTAVGVTRAVAMVAVAGVLATSTPAMAQSAATSPSGAAIGTFHPAPAGSDYFVGDSLDLRGQVRPSARVLIDWAHNPLVVRNPDGTIAGTPVQNQLWFNIGGALNLFDRARLFINVPVAAYQNGSQTRVGGVELMPERAGGIGDFAFGADVRIWGQYDDVVTVAAGVSFTAPTGSRENMLGDGSFTVLPHVSVAGRKSFFTYAASVGFDLRNTAIGAADFGNELRFTVCAGVKLVSDKLLVGPEVFGFIPVGQSLVQRSAGVEGDVGAHYALTEQWRLGAGVGTGFARSAGVPDVRALVSVDWAMPVGK